MCEAEVEERCVTQQGITLNVRAVIAFKVGNDSESIVSAGQRFLSDQNQMAVLTGRIFAGHLRSIIGSMTVEQIIKERQKLATEVLDGSKEEMIKIGLTVDALQIQSIDDGSLGYILAMSAPHNAAIQQQAQIAQAKANQAAAEAEQESQRNQAEYARQTAIVQAQYKAEVDKAQAEASPGGTAGRSASPARSARDADRVGSARRRAPAAGAGLGSGQARRGGGRTRPDSGGCRCRENEDPSRSGSLAQPGGLGPDADRPVARNRQAGRSRSVRGKPDSPQRRRRARRDSHRPGGTGPGNLRFSAWRTRSTPFRGWVRPNRTQRAARWPAVTPEKLPNGSGLRTRCVDISSSVREDRSCLSAASGPQQFTVGGEGCLL